MKIRLIIPHDHPNRNIEPIAVYGPRIADIAGGFTAWRATGGWKDAKGDLIVEPVTVIDTGKSWLGVPDDGAHASAYANAYDNLRNEFRALAATIAKDLSQECVYLEIDGIVEYVKPV